MEGLRGVIIDELIRVSGKDKIILQQNHVSKVLFNDLEWIRTNWNPKRGSRLEITTLYRMLYYVRNLKFSGIKGILAQNRIDQDFDKVQFLKTIQAKLEKRIENFIFSNPYTKPYIDPTFGAKFYKPKFDITMEILFALSDKYSTVEVDGRKEVLTFKACQELLKSSVFGQFLRETKDQMTYDYSSNTLNRYKNKLKVLLDQDIYNSIETATNGYITKQNIPEGGSKSEDLLRFYMEYIFGAEFKAVYPSWLINPSTGKLLELDGYNEILGIAFEVDGPDHYDVTWIKERYSLTLKEATDRLEYRRKVDEFKTEECKRRGIKLFRIRLDQFSWKDFNGVVEGIYESSTGKRTNKEKIDYKIAMRIISTRFLNLRF